MLHSGWKIKKLGNLLDFKNGMNTDKSQYGSGPKFVNVMDVFNNDEIDDNKIIGRVNASEKQLSNYKIKYGDILFNRTSEVFDEIAMSAVYIDTGLVTFGGFVIRGRPITKELNVSFCIYLFQSQDFRKQAIRMGQGAIRSNIGQKDLAKIEIKYPPLQEQKKIAKILSTWDKAISTTQKLIDNSQQQKKALMQQLLTGKRRFDGFDGVWCEYKLGNIGYTFNGLTGKTKKDFGQGEKFIPYVNIFNNSSVDINTLQLVNIKPNENQNLVIYGDILFTTSSETPYEVGMSSVFLSKTKEKIYLNSFCFGFRLNSFETILPEFMQYLLRSEGVRRSIIMLAQGATRYNLSKVQLMKIIIKIPNMKEQKKIETALTNTDKELETQKQQLTNLKQEKKALMQQLLTGKLRVKTDNQPQEHKKHTKIK